MRRRVLATPVVGSASSSQPAVTQQNGPPVIGASVARRHRSFWTCAARQAQAAATPARPRPHPARSADRFGADYHHGPLGTPPEAVGTAVPALDPAGTAILSDPLKPPPPEPDGRNPAEPEAQVPP